MILETLEVGPFASNCYIVGSETSKEGIIIDPGAEAKTILRATERLELSIPWVVLTHSHIDHITALRPVMEGTGAKLAIHQAEGDAKLTQVFARMFGPLMGGSLKSLPAPDRLLQDGDKVEVDGLSFGVLHTPGHSPGGISLVGYGMVFCGDTLFNLSIGRTDFPGSSYAQLISSIKSKLLTLPDETIVLPGHGPQSTIGFERQLNPFLQG
jgi:glyoxylase-like metal-dependent hydrolase (beta-lactamase superfamily II)